MKLVYCKIKGNNNNLKVKKDEMKQNELNGR